MFSKSDKQRLRAGKKFIVNVYEEHLADLESSKLAICEMIKEIEERDLVICTIEEETDRAYRIMIQKMED